MNEEAGTQVMKMIQIKVKDPKKTSVTQIKNDPKRFYYHLVTTHNNDLNYDTEKQRK